MHKFAVVLACITCISGAEKPKENRPLQSLATLLLTANEGVGNAFVHNAGLRHAGVRNAGVRMQARPFTVAQAATGDREPPLQEPGPGFELIPPYGDLERIEGGKAILTYKMPIWADRCQYLLKTEGRPLRCQAQIWIGPERTVHTVKTDCDDGNLTPIYGTIKFKKLAPVLKITTDSELEYPILAAVSVPTPERSKQLDEIWSKNWKGAIKGQGEQKQISQGGTVGGGKGSVRYWNIPSDVKSVQILGFSHDVGKKSFKMDFEVLQGPNTIKQKFYLQCGGSTQPWHGVVQTPGEGCVIRVVNKKFLEDGRCEIAILPFEYEEAPPEP